MKKLRIIFVVLLAFVLVGCFESNEPPKPIEPDKPIEPVVEPCVEHVDANKDCVCDKCGDVIAHIDLDKDCKCDVCNTQLEHQYENGECIICHKEEFNDRVIKLYTTIGELEKYLYTVKEQSVFELPVLEYAGYIFKGWTEKDSEELLTTYTPTDETTGLIELFAVWEVEPTDEEYLAGHALFVQINGIKLENVVSTWLPRLTQLKEQYDELTERAKSYVPNYQTLVDALDKAGCLVNAEPVIALIDSLSVPVLLGEKEIVQNARLAYDALTAHEKEFVKNYQVLEKAEIRIIALEQECGNYPDLINAGVMVLPYDVSYDFASEVKQLMDMYNQLSVEQKSLIENYGLLERAYNQILSIEQNKNEITYCLGKDVFATRHDLGINWFKDFYKFILYNGGQSLLESEGIYSVDTFVDRAQDWDYGNGTMRYLGNTFSQYYLVRDLNGILENQTEEGFFGFCYQNNRYEDFIFFLMKFFAYWRLDEGYANSTNYGADALVDRWATLVDTCKFFYCEYGKSPVPRTTRMGDCFNFCSNVVYGDLPTTLSGTVTLPTSLTRRGYTFAGWYDNPEFKGSPITSVTKGTKKVVLYAKWNIDQAQKDIDAAAFVDVYIYNLTTDPAKVEKRTVTYVKDMYNKLTSNAKSLVTNYATLKSYIDQYCTNQLENPITVNVYYNLENKTFNDLQQNFISDFNSFNGISITYSDLINNQYGNMAKMRSFFNDVEMNTKWSWLLTYFTEIDCYFGVQVQAKRGILKQGGDMEYLCKAIGYYFSQSDATSDTEVAFDFSTPDISGQNKVTYTFSTETELPPLELAGYTFAGYYSDDHYTNRIYNVTDELPTVLYAKFIKK